MDSVIPPTELGIVSPGECNLEMQHIRVAFESCSSSFGNLVWGFSLFSAMAFAERAGEFLSPSGFVRVGLD